MRFTTLLLVLVLCSSVSASDRPNVVIILADDLGWGSVGCYGADPELVRTPHIDRLAREGRRFTDANTTSSVCSPTRYALMTGRYCWRTSLISEVLGTTAPLHIETERLTIASLLKAQGYQCAAVGKWHLGYGTAEKCDFTKELRPGPLEIGFDYHFGVPSNHGDVSGVYVEDHWVYGLDRSNPGLPGPPYQSLGQQKGRTIQSLSINAPKRTDDEVMQTLTGKAASWIGCQSKDRPFFLYYTPVAVHNPITPSTRNAGTTRGGSYCDFLQDLDDSVGEILKALDEHGFADNTLVIFSSDNGGVNKLNGNTPQNIARDAGLRPVGPFRGGKHDVWEGGFRVPYLVRWPGHVPAGTVCDETISLVDTLASLATVTGTSLPPATESVRTMAAEDSHDVSAAWLGTTASSPIRPDLIVHSADGTFAIRRSGWKWIEGIPASDIKPASRKARAEQFRPMLFDISHDVTEASDTLQQNPELAGELEHLLNQYRNGGYSRALPPWIDAPAVMAPTLPPMEGTTLLELTPHRFPEKPWTTSGAAWMVRDDALWTNADNKGSSLTSPVEFGDGTVEFQVLLGNANRHSLRVHTQDDSSFRIVLTHAHLDITRNPAQGQPASSAVSLARQKITFQPNDWQTLRLTFEGNKLTAHIADRTIMAEDEVFGKQKSRLHFIAFDGTIGIKSVRVAGTTRPRASSPTR